MFSYALVGFILIILKWFFGKRDRRIWTGMVWIGRRKCGERLWM